jgi:hypothetical protein
MGRRCRVAEAGPWVVKSISVKARDGPSRIERAYHILLEIGNEPVIARINRNGDNLPVEKENNDAHSDLC